MIAELEQKKVSEAIDKNNTQDVSNVHPDLDIKSKPINTFTLTFKKEEKLSYPAEEPKSKEELEKAYNFHLIIFKKGHPENCKVKIGKISPTKAKKMNMKIKNAKRSNDYKIILPIVVEK